MLKENVDWNWRSKKKGVEIRTGTQPAMEVERQDIRVGVEGEQVARTGLLVLFCCFSGVQEIEEMSVKLMSMTTKFCKFSFCVRACVICVCVYWVNWEEGIRSGVVERQRTRGSVFWDEIVGNAGDGRRWVVVEITVGFGYHTRCFCHHGFYHRWSIDDLSLSTTIGSKKSI